MAPALLGLPRSFGGTVQAGHAVSAWESGRGRPVVALATCLASCTPGRPVKPPSQSQGPAADRRGEESGWREGRGGPRCRGQWPGGGSGPVCAQRSSETCLVRGLGTDHVGPRDSVVDSVVMSCVSPGTRGAQSPVQSSSGTRTRLRPCWPAGESGELGGGSRPRGLLTPRQGPRESPFRTAPPPEPGRPGTLAVRPSCGMA